MKKIVSGVGIIVLLQAALFAAGKGHKVSGEVLIGKKGTIYLQLITRDIFEKKSKELGYAIIIQVTDDDLKAGKVKFSLRDVEEGVYAVQAYQDLNGNGAMDKGKFGPKEPWGFFRSVRLMFRGPNFDEVSFEVKGDMQDIRFPVK